MIRKLSLAALLASTTVTAAIVVAAAAPADPQRGGGTSARTGIAPVAESTARPSVVDNADAAAGEINATLRNHATVPVAQWVWHEVDGDAALDVATLDADFNGCTEELWFDLNNNGVVESHLYNSAYDDCFLEVFTFDLNEDGIVEQWAVDSDQLEGFDVAYSDQNLDGFWDYSWSLPGTVADLVAPTTATVGPPSYDGIFGLCITMAELTNSTPCF